LKTELRRWLKRLPAGRDLEETEVEDASGESELEELEETEWA